MFNEVSNVQVKNKVQTPREWGETVIKNLRCRNAIPSQIGVIIDDVNLYKLEGVDDFANANANAAYFSHNEDDMTQYGKDKLKPWVRGLIVVGEAYLGRLRRLPEHEQRNTLISTLRHELRHEVTHHEGLVEHDKVGETSDLNEVISHCENVLNRQMRGKEEAPLWNQIENWRIVVGLYEPATVKALMKNRNFRPLCYMAKRDLKYAQSKIKAQLNLLHGHPELIRKWDEGVFALDGNKSSVTLSQLKIELLDQKIAEPMFRKRPGKYT
jgi:hypothetical protein